MTMPDSAAADPPSAPSFESAFSLPGIGGGIAEWASSVSKRLSAVGNALGVRSAEVKGRDGRKNESGDKASSLEVEEDRVGAAAIRLAIRCSLLLPTAT